MYHKLEKKSGTIQFRNLICVVRVRPLFIEPLQITENDIDAVDTCITFA